MEQPLDYDSTEIHHQQTESLPYAERREDNGGLICAGFFALVGLFVGFLIGLVF